MKRVIAICAALLAPFAVAQNVMVSPQRPTAPVMAKFATPQQTISQLMRSVAANQQGRARETLDLSQISFIVRDLQGWSAAQFLYAALGRADDLSSIEAPEGATSVIVPVGPPGSIELRLTEDSGWMFSVETVANASSTWQHVRFQPWKSGYPRLDEDALAANMSLRDRVPAKLHQGFLGLELWQWLGILALALLCFIAGLLSRLLVRVAMKAGLLPVESRLNPDSVRNVRRAVGLLAATAIAWWTWTYLDLPPIIVVIGVLVLKTAWAFAIAWAVSAAFDIALDLASNRAETVVQRANHILIPIARKLGKFIIFAIACFGLAASLDVNVAGLIAGLGIGGLVVALAAKDSVENVFGSLTILFDMPFGIDDLVKIGDLVGTVEEINLRSTRIRTQDDSMVTLPNSNLIKASVENFGLRRYRRMQMNLIVQYSADPATIQRFIDEVMKVLQDDPGVRDDGSQVAIENLDPAGYSVHIQAFLLAADSSEELELRNRVLSNIAKVSQTVGVTFGSASMPVGTPETPPTT